MACNDKKMGVESDRVWCGWGHHWTLLKNLTVAHLKHSNGYNICLWIGRKRCSVILQEMCWWWLRAAVSADLMIVVVVQLLFLLHHPKVMCSDRTIVQHEYGMVIHTRCIPDISLRIRLRECGDDLKNWQLGVMVLCFFFKAEEYNH